MDELVAKLKRDFPQFNFRAGQSFCWSPNQQEIVYSSNNSKPASLWALLHELSHALLSHSSYSSDFELLRLEVAAWDKAQELEATYSQKINTEHIQNCLDTYREWLHRRSTCPTCGNSSLQQSTTKYHCFNCHAVWKVTASRFCRPYRQINVSENKKSSELIAQTTFM